MLLKILLAGDGGQGIQTIADILCTASFQKNWQVSFIPNYGLEQRGGVSLAFIQISDQKINYPKFSKADILVILSDQARKRVESYKHAGTRIFDYGDFVNILAENKVREKSWNIFALGWLAKILKEQKILETDIVNLLLEEKLGQKDIWDDNKWAFKVGLK